MNGVYDIVRAVSDYGIQTVISVIFLYWVWIKERKNQKRDEKIMEYLFSLKEHNDNETRSKSEEYNKKTLHQQYLNKRKDITPKVNIKLHDMVNEFDLNRACIFEFHNSNENLTGFPFAKFSCNFESIKRGVTPFQLNEASNIPYSSLGVLIDLFHKYNEQGYVIVDDISIFEENNSFLYQLLKTKDITNIIFFPLYDINNNSFGIVFAEYQNSKNYTQEEFSAMKEYIAYFNSILDNNNPMF